MNLTEKYIWYSKGIIKRNVPEKMQEFFKTTPTPEQLIILDELDQYNNNIVNVTLVLMLGFGILLGGTIVYYYCYFKALLGLPF